MHHNNSLYVLLSATSQAYENFIIFIYGECFPAEETTETVNGSGIAENIAVYVAAELMKNLRES